MKKITALVLALVMTLSLLPMNVWASTDELNQQEQRNNIATPTNYRELYYFDGTEYHANFNADIVNSPYSFRCATEKNAEALVGTAYGYNNSNLSTEGNIGTFLAGDGDCVWNLASATDVEGYLRVEKDNTVYRMKVTINNGRNVFTYHGVDVYTAYDNGVLGYGDWHYDDLTLTINGDNGISMLAPYTGDAETATAYLKPAAGLRLVLPIHRQNYTTLSSVDNNGVYVLTNNNLSKNTSVQVYNEEQLVGEIDLMFVRHDGNQSGSGSPAGELTDSGRYYEEWSGVFIFTEFNNGVLSLGSGVSRSGENGNYTVTVPCQPNTTKTVYLAAGEYDGLTVKRDEESIQCTEMGTWLLDNQFNQTVYAVEATDTDEIDSVTYTVTRALPVMKSFTLVFDFSGTSLPDTDQGEFVKVFETDYTLVKIRNFEGQSDVLNFDKTTNENGDPVILVTIKADDPELWRTVLNREDGLGVRFEIAAKEGTPNVRIHQTDGEAKALAQYIAEWKNNTTFLPYNDPHERNRGGEYATAVYDKDKGETSILATTSAKTFGCSWKYGENDVRTDGFVLKIVVANSDLKFPVVMSDANFVATDRITAIPHAELDKLIKLNMSGNNVVCENGKVTYASAYPINAANYAAFTAAVDAAVTADGIGKNGNGKPMYPLLRVATPDDNYVAKSYKGRFTVLREYSDNSTAMDLEYMWNGFGCEQVYTLTWKHKSDATAPDIVQKLTIVSPSNPDLKWMDMIGQRIPADRVDFTILPEDCGATIDYENGTITTTFDNDTVLDVAPIEESTVTITVPTMNGRKAVAVKFAGDVGIMEDPADPTLTEFTATLIERFKGGVDSGNEVNIQELGLDTVFAPLSPLKEQTYGEEGEIKYFYSTHDGNRFLMLKWIFPNDNNDETPDELYEYMEVEATPYLCEWEEELKKDSEVTDAVEVPTAIYDALANGKIKLVTKIHPQKQEKGYGQYFFELQMVDENGGNVYTDTDGKTYFTIILPYSFMGEDWNYEKAKNLKEKPMITHFDKNFKKLVKDGEITGEYTERGIEFKVNSFSPFTVSWTEETVDTAPSYPGYYYPIVMPEEETVEKPTETKPTTPPVTEEVVTPAPEDTTPVVPDEPVADDAPAADAPPVVDDAPQSETTNDIGLWIGVALVVLVIAIVIVAVAIKRKK